MAEILFPVDYFIVFELVMLVCGLEHTWFFFQTIKSNQFHIIDMPADAILHCSV